MSKGESEDFRKAELNTTRESDSCFFGGKSFCGSGNNVSLITRDTLINDLLRKVRNCGDLQRIKEIENYDKASSGQDSRGKDNFNIDVCMEPGNSKNLTLRNQILPRNSEDGTDLAKSTFFGSGKLRGASFREVLSDKTRNLVRRINTTISSEKKIRLARRSGRQNPKKENFDSKPASLVDCDEYDSLSSGPENLQDEDFILTELYRKKASKNNRRRRPKS